MVVEKVDVDEDSGEGFSTERRIQDPRDQRPQFLTRRIEDKRNHPVASRLVVVRRGRGRIGRPWGRSEVGRSEMRKTQPSLGTAH